MCLVWSDLIRVTCVRVQGSSGSMSDAAGMLGSDAARSYLAAGVPSLLMKAPKAQWRIASPTAVGEYV